MKKRSYHQHGTFGSHKISTTHKDRKAQNLHDKELVKWAANNLPNKSLRTNKPVLKNKEGILKKVQRVFFNVVEELPIKDGIIIADLTKLKRPIFIKFKANNKLVEMSLKSE